MYAFLEDRRAPQGEPAAWLFDDPVDCLVAHDLPSLLQLLAAMEAGGYWSVLAIDYELGHLFEPKSTPDGWRPDAARPLIRCWRFRQRVEWTAPEAEAWLAREVGEAEAGVGNVRPVIDEADYLAAVAKVQAYIAAGDCYQVNYTFPLSFDWFGTPLAVYARLRRQQPVSYGGFIGDAQQGIVSLSPELFLERRGRRLMTRPMKGTAPRDLPQAVLAGSEKDRAENLMIVDLLRNDLGRIALNGTVNVDQLFEIEAYPSVWQMVSAVSAEIGRRSFYDVLAALFPCGSITGAPKVRAMQIASELEGGPRGIYTGAIGWYAPDGNFRLNVAIRTLSLSANGVGTMGVGSGIVADSVAEAEWDECQLKAGFLRRCDPGLRLIETLRREAGAYPRLAGHLARLRHSAAWFGFPLDETQVVSLLAEQPEVGTWRVRLTLGKAGDIEVASFPLLPEPPGPRWARLGSIPVESGNPLQRHKTTARAVYDAALRSIAENPAVFDVIFLNERGEVAEGARSSVFVERDGKLLTPPLTSGALPGVLRAELLACGAARESVLMLEDLADGFLLGNALRGLQPVRLEPAAA